MCAAVATGGGEKRPGSPLGGGGLRVLRAAAAALATADLVPLDGVDEAERTGDKSIVAP